MLIYLGILSDSEDQHDSESSVDETGQHDETASEDDGLSDDLVTMYLISELVLQNKIIEMGDGGWRNF